MTFMILEFIEYLNFFPTSKFSIHPFFLQHSKIPTLDSRLSRNHLSFTNKPTNDDDDDAVRGDDLELLMENLGYLSGEKLPEVLNSADIVNIFEEEEPRLEEVKEAFDVFDVNKDGFIDAEELQRVICVLGLKGRIELEDCRKMIGVFDENADGRIDFHEFVKFMENTL